MQLSRLCNQLLFFPSAGRVKLLNVSFHDFTNYVDVFQLDDVIVVKLKK